MHRLVLLVGLALAGLAPSAEACPPGPCNKYRHMTRPVVTPRPTVYLRTIAGVAPAFSYRSIAGFLSGSTWDPMLVRTTANAVVAPSPKLRFKIANVARRPIDSSVRSVLIRRIERRAGLTLVEVDGDVFALARCGSVRRPIACLKLRGDLTLDEPQLDPSQFGGHGYGGGAGFAQPPP
jgi:hypothetical protein